MKICDKCEKKGQTDVIIIKGKKYDLCSECSNHIKEWLEKKEDNGFIFHY